VIVSGWEIQWMRIKQRLFPSVRSNAGCVCPCSIGTECVALSFDWFLRQRSFLAFRFDGNLFVTRLLYAFPYSRLVKALRNETLWCRNQCKFSFTIRWSVISCKWWTLYLSLMTNGLRWHLTSLSMTISKWNYG